MTDVLDEVLRSAQDLGFLGPRPIQQQREHAEALCTLALRGLDVRGDVEFLDLGSGGGLPGLVLALRPDAPPRGTLLDSQHRRTAFLQQAVERLDLAGRIEVVTARAEDAGRDADHRERYELVISRGFGAPAVTTECAVAFLGDGGRLVVSEPPEPDPTRWNEEVLADLGLTSPELTAHGAAHAAVLHRRGALDARWPRRAGIPQKRPLW